MRVANSTPADRRKGTFMTCAVCGAPGDKGRNYCAICGFIDATEAKQKWDRSVEAWAYEDLQQTLEEGESLLGVTRGRIAGSWKRRLSLNPQTLFSPFVNVGLTADRFILQQIHPSTGRAPANNATALPLLQTVAVSASDADPMESRTVRLNVVLNTGDSFRLRAAGRLADGAKEISEVWKSLSDGVLRPSVELQQCPHCQRELDRPYKFCPYCGKAQGAA